MLNRLSSSSQSNNPNQQQPPPLMSLNPFTENTRDNSSKQNLFVHDNRNLIYLKDLCSSSTIYENTPPALMSMPISHYDNNNDNINNIKHDDYGNGTSAQVEQAFDLSMVTTDIPYYDLPAGLMCLLVTVKLNFRIFCFVLIRSLERRL